MRKDLSKVIVLSVLLQLSQLCAADSTEKDKAFADLLPHIQARIKAKELFVQMDVMGHNQRVQVASADDKSLIVKSEGTDSPLPWRLVSADTVAALGKAASQESV